MSIPLLDLQAQMRTIEDEIRAAIDGVLESAQFILGPNVRALEEEIAEYIGVAHAVGVASGTDALTLSLRALSIGKGDEVIVPTFSFFASVEAVMAVGATPVFVDIDATSYGLRADDVAAKITSRTKAIMPVHLYGRPVDMEPFIGMAAERGVALVEDSAQAIGAELRGRKVAGIGDVGCLSFFPSKNLGGLGDGGMVTTNDPAIAATVRALRTHGWTKKYYPELLGCNSRLDEIQAAVLRVKLRYLDGWNQARRELASHYRDRLDDAGINLPEESSEARHVYHMFVVRVAERDAVQAFLADRHIASAVYYPVPLHLTEACASMGHEAGDFPIAEQAARECLALPLFPEMTAAQVDTVCEALLAALRGHGTIRAEVVHDAAG